MKVFYLSDHHECAFMIVHGVELLRVERGADRRRCTFVLADPDGRGDSLRRRYAHAEGLQRVLRTRRHLARLAQAARESASGVVLPSDLNGHAP